MNPFLVGIGYYLYIHLFLRGASLNYLTNFIKIEYVGSSVGSETMHLGGHGVSASPNLFPILIFSFTS